MSQQSLEIDPAAEYTILVTLTYGDKDSPTVRRYCRWTESITISGDTFTAEPTLDYIPSDQHGGTEDKACKLEIVNSRQPFDRLITGYAHSPVKVKIEQINPRTLDSRSSLYFGRIASVTKNPASRKGLVRANLFGLKARLADVKVAWPALTTCPNKFGTNTRHCRVPNEADWIRTGTVTALGDPAQNAITITGLTGVTDPATDLSNLRYRRGLIKYDGLLLVIKRSLEDGRFELFRLPPPWLAGQVVTLRPGCDGRLETCRLWNNEINFNGIGIKIPPRNPIFGEGE